MIYLRLRRGFRVRAKYQNKMKRSTLIVLTGCLLLAGGLAAKAQESRNVRIPGDHGLLDAVIQTPGMSPDTKVPLVVICHGFTSNKETPLVRAIADSLLDKGIASIRFDFNGHGKSEGKFEDMTVPNEIEDAKCVVAYALQLPWVSEVSLVGHSQGGVVASMVAGELQGGIHSLALCAPAAALRDDALQGQLQGASYDAGDVPETVSLPGRDLKVGRNYIKTAQTLPIYETAARYNGPVIIVHGTADRIVPYTYGERYKYVYGDRACLALLSGADHSFTTDESRARVASLVSGFVLDRKSR